MRCGLLPDGAGKEREVIARSRPPRPTLHLLDIDSDDHLRATAPSCGTSFAPSQAQGTTNFLNTQYLEEPDQPAAGVALINESRIVADAPSPN